MERERENSMYSTMCMLRCEIDIVYVVTYSYVWESGSSCVCMTCA